MATTTASTTAGANGTRPGAKSGKGGKGAGGNLVAWLRTREGKITAGAAAVAAVVLLALRRGSGTGGAAGFVPSAIQGGPDGTLQGQLDQISGPGGTYNELIGAVTGLSGDVNNLTDLLEAQNPLPPTTAKPAAPKPKAGWSGFSIRRIGAVGTPVSLRGTAARFSPSQNPDAIESTLRRIVALNPSLKGKKTIPGGYALKVPIWK